jgi:hypothetical protein
MSGIGAILFYTLAPLVILLTGTGITLGLLARAFSLHTHKGWRRGAKLDKTVSGICSLCGACVSAAGTLLGYCLVLPSWETQMMGALPFAFVALLVYTFMGPANSGRTQ